MQKERKESRELLNRLQLVGRRFWYERIPYDGN